MFLRESILETMSLIVELQFAIVQLASKNITTVLPGYTHLQCAQPILFAHHLLAYVEMLNRDYVRFEQTYQETNVMPLGSGALAGVPYNIDRYFLASLLKFDSLTNNSIDAVSDRDFALDYLYASSLTAVHLSRLAEEMIIWNSNEFGFIDIDDAFCTGSSIMPQKKNPDVVELVRAKTGRLIGNLVSLLIVMKALPLAYNKDMQEDKEKIFDSVDNLNITLKVMADFINSIVPDSDKMKKSVAQSFSLATDLADYLVGKGVPFRKAHEIVGSLVKWAIANNYLFEDLTLADFRKFSSYFEEDVKEISIENSIASRNVYGGTSSQKVSNAIENLIENLKIKKNKLIELRQSLPSIDSIYFDS